MNKKEVLKYYNRDFDSIRQDLLNFIQTYYADMWTDFMAPSPSSAILDLVSYVGDLLSTELNQRYNDLFVDGASTYYAAYKLASLFGLKIYPAHSSITLVDIIIDVPPTSTGPNTLYLPIIKSGLQLVSNNVIFETTTDVDFNSDFNEYGIANRKIIPIVENGTLQRYRIIKREIVKAGITRIHKEVVTAEQARPFFSFVLPHDNVVDIISIIEKPGTNYESAPDDDEFYNENIRFYEVDNLLVRYILEKQTNALINYKNIQRKFCREYTYDGKCKIIFGAYIPSADVYQDFLLKSQNSQLFNIELDYNFEQLFLNASVWGTAVKPNTTLFVKYRTGGGVATNIAADQIINIQNIKAVFLGNDQNIINNVLQSMIATNVIPAYGGKDKPTKEEILQTLKAYFDTQKRCVTLNDYINTVFEIDPKYAAVFRVNGEIKDNKVLLYVITKNAYNKLNFATPQIVKNNIKTYLEKYRMINDFVEIHDGYVVNIEVIVSVLANKNYHFAEIKKKIIQVLTNYFNLNNWFFNQHIYISEIIKIIQNVEGVINVVDVSFYNLVGGNYSHTVHNQATTSEFVLSQDGTVHKYYIQPVDNTIYSNDFMMFELRYPETDIKVKMA